jgi:inner membrane protein
MVARSHVLIGLAGWLVAAPGLHLPPLDAVSLGLAAGGALLPDLDHPKSWVGRRTRPLSTLLAAVLGHRGLTHSALAVFALAALLAHAGSRRGVVWPVVVGYMSHLAADLLTARGLRLAWPLRRHWGVPLCRTGSPAEPLIVLTVCGLAVWSLMAAR